MNFNLWNETNAYANLGATMCNNTCDITNLSYIPRDTPLLLIAGIIVLMGVMYGVLKLMQWISYPRTDPC